MHLITKPVLRDITRIKVSFIKLQSRHVKVNLLMENILYAEPQFGKICLLTPGDSVIITM